MALRMVGKGSSAQAVTYKQLEQAGVNPKGAIDNPDDVLAKINGTEASEVNAPQNNQLVFKSGYSLEKRVPQKDDYVLRFKVADLKKETEKAFGVSLGMDDIGKLAWIPKSQIIGAVMGKQGEKDLQGFVVSAWYGKNNMHSGGAMEKIS